jgi:uncharacterized iron-regulated membrane protein
LNASQVNNMRPFRSLLFWIHLTAGVLASIVIFVMSFTGVVLALKPQIQNWVERDVRYVTPLAAPRLTAQQLITAVRNAKPDATPQSLAIARDPGTAAAVNLGRDGTIYVNPYTGAILGTGSAQTAQFFQTMTSWHRYMGATGEYRATGRSATGLGNLAFLVLALSGLYIWWPKQFALQYLKPIVWFRGAATGRARDFNWHNTIGFWCLIPIVIMTVSGAVISYPWASNLVYRLTGSPVPARGGAGSAATGAPRNDARPENGGLADPETPIDLDRAWSRAEQQMPTWSLLSARLPTHTGAPVAFTITDGANWNAFARSTLTVDSASGDVVQWQPYEGSSLGQKVRGWLRFAHTGELGGLAGQIVAGIGCLGGVVLVYTGLALAFRRLWNWSIWSRVRPRHRGRFVVTSAADNAINVGAAALGGSAREPTS